jgi:hypothetical protein
MIIDPFFVFLEPVLGRIPGLSPIGDDPDLTFVIEFVDISLCGWVEPILSIRISVDLIARDINDVAMIAKIKNDAILMPLGCSMIPTTMYERRML